MEIKEELIEWSKKVSDSKKDLDKKMFDQLLEQTISLIERKGWDSAENHAYKYINAKQDNRRGPRLLGINSQVIHQKMWSLKRKEKKDVKKS
ncbi:MAG: hypothetical protein V3U92_19720 [Cellulophaga sp.]